MSLIKAHADVKWLLMARIVPRTGLVRGQRRSPIAPVLTMTDRSVMYSEW